jgi:hypothetical protein
VLSFDSFFSDVGAVVGQVGLGYAAQAVSKAAAYTIGGAIYVVSVPLYRRAGKASELRAASEPPETGDVGETPVAAAGDDEVEPAG